MRTALKAFLGTSLAACWLFCNQPAAAQSSIAHTLVRNPNPVGIFNQAYGAPVYNNGPNSPSVLLIDLNHDGQIDYRVVSSANTAGEGFQMEGIGTNSTWARPTGGLDVGSLVVPLTLGTLIGSVLPPEDTWVATWNYPLATVAPGFSSYSSAGVVGLFTNQTAYAGLRFAVGTNLHYGWIKVEEMPWLAGGGVVYEYAYETRPNTPICAGAKPVPMPLATPQVVRPGHLRLTWPAETGKAYQVQCKENLTTPLWTNLNFSVIGTTTNTAVDIPITGTTKFFRVVEAD